MRNDDDDDDDGNAMTDAKMKSTLDTGWSVGADGSLWQAYKTVDEAPAGVYEVGYSTRLGIVLEPKKLKNDELIALPGHGCEDVMQEIEKFWALRPKFEECGLTHKRGVLLYGEPGTGKTSILNLLIKQMIEKVDGIVLMQKDLSNMAAGLQLVRNREPNRPIMMVFEDIDDMRNQESQMLALLDGENQVNGVVTVATTNYLDRLPSRIRQRPSRFDLVIEVDMPGAEARIAYLNVKEASLQGAELDEWVMKTEGYSLAALKELIILSRVYGLELDAALERLRKLTGGAKKMGVSVKKDALISEAA